MAHQLVRQRPRNPADPEREDDVLDGRAVARLDHALDQLLLLRAIDLAGDRAAEDLVRLQLRIASAAGRVDQRHIEALDDVLVGEQERRLHPEIAAPRVARDAGLLARRGRGRSRQGRGRRRLGQRRLGYR